MATVEHVGMDRDEIRRLGAVEGSPEWSAIFRIGGSLRCLSEKWCARVSHPVFGTRYLRVFSDVRRRSGVLDYDQNVWITRSEGSITGFFKTGNHQKSTRFALYQLITYGLIGVMNLSQLLNYPQTCQVIPRRISNFSLVEKSYPQIG